MHKWFLVAFFLTLAIYTGGNLAQPAGSAECPADYDGYLAPRLTVDEWARVLPGTPLNFRPEASTRLARIGQLNSGTMPQVTDGPRCNEGYVWWQVDDAGQVGWVAEGNPSNGDYWLEPRGVLVYSTGADGSERPYVIDADGFVEPAGCMRPPDDYSREQIGYATLNERTLAMLDQAQVIYDSRNPNGPVNFRQAITQGSYNPGGVSASFGTHDGGGAVDLSVRSYVDWSVLTAEIPPMIEALRIAGFAAWLRDTGSLYEDSPIHIHAIAVGDADLSPIARAQIDGERGYLRGYNGLPEAYGAPIPDEHGGPVICGWMVADGWGDQRALNAADYAEQGAAAFSAGDYALAAIRYGQAVELAPDETAYVQQYTEALDLMLLVD